MYGDWPTCGGEMAARIRAFDWRATPLGPVAAWPQSLKTALDICLGSGFPSCIWWGSELTQLYNDMALPIVRPKHPAALGLPACEAWREIWGDIGPLLEQVLTTGQPVTRRDMPLQPDCGRGPQTVYFTFTYSPLRDEAGALAGVMAVAIETTAQVASDAALREDRERLRLALDVGELATWDWELGDGRLTWSEAHYRMQGYEPGEISPTYESWAARVHPDDLPVTEAALAEALERREPFAARFRVVRPGGEIGWLASRGRYVFDEQGNPVRLIGVLQDVSESRRAVEDLRDGQERYRQLAEASSDVLWIRDAETLELEFLSPSFQRMYGLTVEGALYGDHRTTWTDLIYPNDRARARDLIEKVRAGERVTLEYRIQRADTGEVRWIRDTDFPIRDGSGRVRRIGGVVRDVSQEKKAAHQQAMLLAELQHRTRNLLGVIRSVARRTAETSDDLESFLTHFDGRLSAIARTQTTLTRNHEVSAGLDAVILEEFLAAAGAEQVTLDGPEVQLSGKVAESIGLAVHELVTNALKYGALTKPKGHVYVTWEVSQREGGPVLALDWRETGVGIIDVQPARIGFGRRLLEKALPDELGALTTLQFAPGGLRASIEVPLQADGEELILGA